MRKIALFLVLAVSLSFALPMPKNHVEKVLKSQRDTLNDTIMLSEIKIYQVGEKTFVTYKKHVEVTDLDVLEMLGGFFSGDNLKNKKM